MQANISSQRAVARLSANTVPEGCAAWAGWVGCEGGGSAGGRGGLWDSLRAKAWHPSLRLPDPVSPVSKAMSGDYPLNTGEGRGQAHDSGN